MRSHLLLVVAALLASGCALQPRQYQEPPGRLEEASRKLLSNYREQVAEAEAEGKDGVFYRRLYESTFKAIAARYRASNGHTYIPQIVARTEREILSYIPDCWR